jgi:Ca-activated chloride channel family protein
MDEVKSDWQSASENYRFSAAVAGFSQLLRDNDALEEFDYDDVLTLATQARGSDDFGYRSEFINLVKTAQALALD